MRPPGTGEQSGGQTQPASCPWVSVVWIPHFHYIRHLISLVSVPAILIEFLWMFFMFSWKRLMRLTWLVLGGRVRKSYSHDIKYATKSQILMIEFQIWSFKKGGISRKRVFPDGCEIISLVSSVHRSSLAFPPYLWTVFGACIKKSAVAT